MSNESALFDIIIFAAVAIFLALKLRGVLGEKTGYQKEEDEDVDNEFSHLTKAPVQEVVRPEILTPDMKNVEMTAQAGVERIMQVEREFTPQSFLAGAEGAFETILSAFAKGDLNELKSLLGKSVYKHFETAIKERQKAKERLDSTLIRMVGVKILEADVRRQVATIKLKFETEQVNLLYDKENNLTAGNPDQICEIEDIWTFSRKLNTDDPNWTLVKTEDTD